ncbi:hypothetical protein C5167_031643 [Papaver somniferum]|uniref:DUF4408 domain-containing protein n=1 Tax=Papaver somniferum TaxID=3469 RepID=A0A4Y7K8T4_PAPSO|nr:uncharacterized protein LOC113295659 [Papaver somniferum]RZC68405.1 hypothetical protein C5167_031643 [Papaver somniferum]
MAVMSNWAFSLKVLLISTGVLSMAILLKVSVPVVLEFLISEIPVFWSSILSWLTPPYLYVIINGIIITIAASSRFHQNKNQEFKPLLVPVISAPAVNNFVGYDDTMMMMTNMKNSMEIRTGFEGMSSYDQNHQVVGYEQQHHGVAEKNLITNGMFGFGYDHHHHHEVAVKNTNLVEFEDLKKPKVYHEQKQAEENLIIPERKKMKNKLVLNDDKENGFMISRSSWTPPIIRTDSMENIQTDNEKPPASSRFNHKKSVKASPEGGKTLGVTKPKRHETLETTWKTITDGRSMPLTRHLKKSDTWEARHHQQDQLTPKLMKKSETFTERCNNNNQSSPGKLRKNTHKKEPSLSQDDLNRRVEAFINKFNEDMRLQRQESLNQYNEMVRQR